MKTLIAYYSRANENYVNGSIRNLEVGNTRIAAMMIQEQIPADLFEIVPVTAYASKYTECIREAAQDLKANARPQLQQYLDSIAQYDMIYIAYPNYWGTMPMIIRTFLEHYDFSGKTIKPLCTHEGSGLSDTVQEIQRMCPQARVLDGLAIRGGEVRNAGRQLAQWIQEK